MTDRVDHGPKPGPGVITFRDRLDAIQKAGTLSTATGEKNARGEDFVRIPPWLKRTGNRGFTIDTGLGVVKCYLSAEAETEAEQARRGVQRYPDEPDAEFNARREETFNTEYAVRVLREIPDDWPAEIDVPLLELHTGDCLMQPGIVHGMTVEAKRAYLYLMPPSLPAQIIASLTYMGIPAIVYEPRTAPDPTPAANSKS